MQMQMQWAKTQKGFTIVELLVVVVVIAILAAITIVSYNGIQSRAKIAAVQSAVSQAAKKISSHAITNNDMYPVSLAAINVSDASVAYQYAVNNETNPRGYCVTTTQQEVSYYIAQTYMYVNGTNTQTLTLSVPATGACPGHAAGANQAITNYVHNPSFEANNTQGWSSRNGSSISVVSTEQHSGSYALRVVTPGVAIDEGTNIYSVSAGGSSPSGAGGIHRGSAWVKAPAGTAMRFHVEEYTADGIYVGGGVAYTYTANGNWQFVTAAKATLVAGNKLRINVSTSSIQARTYYVDDAIITSGAATYNYNDGYSLGWVWNGVANNSTSSGPAL